MYEYLVIVALVHDIASRNCGRYQWAFIVVEYSSSQRQATLFLENLNEPFDVASLSNNFGCATRLDLGLGRVTLPKHVEECIILSATCPLPLAPPLQPSYAINPATQLPANWPRIHTNTTRYTAELADELRFSKVFQRMLLRSDETTLEASKQENYSRWLLNCASLPGLFATRISCESFVLPAFSQIDPRIRNE